MPEITYDPEVKVLNIRLKKGKVADSILKNNCVFDYNKKKEILNIEVLNFNLENLTTR